jgi:FdhE protein
LTQLTREAWLEAHAYLQPVAELCAEIDRTAVDVEKGSREIPRWEDYESDFLAGVPLLQSSQAVFDIELVGERVQSVVDRLSTEASSERLRMGASALASELQRMSGSSARIMDSILDGQGFSPASAGLLRYLGWSVLRRYLRPVLEAYVRWRNEEKWQRRYCPTCGSAPAMAQLIGVDSARIRLLSCGCCGTRWQFRRTECPFCENDSQRLCVVTVEGEGGLRIDYCESCKGYLKTYDGQGNESLLLSDWSSLHLDLVAHDRGLRRMAASLYELESLLGA